MYGLVVYDSQFGNTQQIAQIISDTLSGRGATQPIPVKTVTQLQLQNAELLVVGGPTQRRGISPAILTFLSIFAYVPIRGKLVAAFDTRYRIPSLLSGAAAPRIAWHLKHAGATLLAPPKSFFVAATTGPLEPGEVQRAVDWAQMLLDRAADVRGQVAAVR